MMPWTILALGIAIGSVITVVIAIAFGRRSKREFVQEIRRLQTELDNVTQEANRQIRVAREEFEAKGLIQAEHLAKVIKSRYALMSQTTRLISEVLDFEGNCAVTRAHEGLITSEGLSLSYMQHHFECLTPGASIEKVVLVHSGSTEGVELEIIQQKPTIIVFHVLFPDKMTSLPGGVNYEYRVYVQRGVLMTKEEADIAYAEDASQQEGFFHDNDVPTKLLELEVIFPADYPAHCSSHVYIGGSWVPHIEETKKLQMQTTTRGAKLRIENPIQGFRYLIDWLSPTREQFAEIRKKSAQTGTGNAVNR